jgi:hypothetical protein
MVLSATAEPRATTAELGAAVRAYWTVRRAAWTLVAVGVLLRAWVVLGGYFYGDDFIFQARAWRLPLTPEYLVAGHDGHVMPSAFALQWFVTRTWPMNYAPLALILIASYALACVLFAHLALRLWGTRWWILLPIVVVCVTPLTLPMSVWWSAALNGLPVQIALTGLLIGVVALVREGRRAPVVLAAVGWVALLGFGEKVVVTPWLALLVAPVLVSDRAWWRAILDVFRRARVVWTVLALVSAGYVAVYALAVDQAPAGRPYASQVVELVGRAVATTVAPAYVGGPLDWVPLGPVAAVAAPPLWLSVIALEAIALLVLVSCIRSRAARRAWVWVAATLLLDLGLVIAARITPAVDPLIVQGLRYTNLVVVPLGVATGVSLASLTLPTARALSWLGVPQARQAPAARIGVLVLTLCVVVASLVSTARFRDLWRANPAQPYVTVASAQLADAADGPPVIDHSVPPEVLSPLTYPYNQVSWLLSPVSPRPEFGDPTSDFRVLAADGRLVPAAVVGPSSLPGPVEGCGWLVDDATAVRLEASVVEFRHTVLISYTSTSATTAAVSLGRAEPRKVPFEQGAGQVAVTLSGRGDQVRFADPSGGASVCISSVSVGLVEVAQ